MVLGSVRWPIRCREIGVMPDNPPTATYWTLMPLIDFHTCRFELNSDQIRELDIVLPAKL